MGMKMRRELKERKDFAVATLRGWSDYWGSLARRVKKLDAEEIDFRTLDPLMSQEGRQRIMMKIRFGLKDKNGQLLGWDIEGQLLAELADRATDELVTVSKRTDATPDQRDTRIRACINAVRAEIADFRRPITLREVDEQSSVFEEGAAPELPRLDPASVPIESGPSNAADFIVGKLAGKSDRTVRDLRTLHAERVAFRKKNRKSSS